MTSNAQVRRVLALVPYLQAHPGAAIEGVARTFGVTERTVLADLQVLWMCGLPGGLPDDLIEIDMDAVRGEGVVNLTNADYLSRPLRFTRDEAVSLVVALQTISEMATGSIQQAAQTAADKLSRIAGNDDQVWLGVASGDADLREALVQAIEAGSRVRLTYDGAARGETTQPLVDPAGIQMRDSRAYLQAWSLERGAWRTYRLDRIIEVIPSGGPVADHGPTPELAEGWFDGSDGEVVLDLAPAAAWVADYYPVRAVDITPDGHLRATFAVADPRWLEALLLRLGDDVLVIEPTGASTSAVRAAQETIALTDELFAGQ